MFYKIRIGEARKAALDAALEILSHHRIRGKVKAGPGEGVDGSSAESQEGRLNGSYSG